MNIKDHKEKMILAQKQFRIGCELWIKNEAPKINKAIEQLNDINL